MLLLVSFQSYGQLSFSGTVSNTENRPIADAEIFIKELGILTQTEEDGSFVFNELKEGTYTLVVFAFGYMVFEDNLSLSGDTTRSIELQIVSQQLSEVVLIQEREKRFALEKLKKVEGTAIYAGKKTEVVLLDQITGNLAANNPRQIYTQVVGLNIQENGDGGLQLNIGGRGLDPNRTANFNTRQNGYDISADALGYPESYYTPPAEALSEIQVVRGAASLQYGPQFGGLVNFKFKRPNPNKEIEWVSRQSLGSFGLATSFNSLGGTVGDLEYYTYFNYKEGSSFRPNSDFNSRNFYGQFGYQLADKTKITFEATFLNYLAQQAGGLTDAQFLEDPTFSNRSRNWFDVDWNLFSLKLAHQFSTNTDFSLGLFTLDASRSALGFRENRVSQEDDLNAPRELLVDEFRNWGAEARLLSRYKIKDTDAVFLIGSKYYQSANSQTQGAGSSESGADFTFRNEEFPEFQRQSQFDLPNLNLAVFGENIFNITSKLSLTPGFRYEYVRTRTDGSFRNVVVDLAGNLLRNDEIPENREFERGFFLFGLGASYTPNSATEFYGNFSQNYRSVTFNDIRVINPSFQVDENISDEDGFTADFGIRGRVQNIFSYDVSVYGLLYDDRLGEILTQETGLNAVGELQETGRLIRLRTNIGTAFIYGFESFGDVNLKELFFSGSEKLKLNYYANLALTQSDYVSSERNNVEGNEVEFIPNVNLKTGVSFGYGNLLGSLQFTYLSEQFTDATNAPQDVTDNQRGIEGTIPGYEILDFSLSYTLGKFKLEGGINNALDRVYFTKRATGYPGPGIIPAEPRTFYTTLQFKL